MVLGSHQVTSTVFKRRVKDLMESLMGMKLIWILDYTSQIWLIILTLVVFMLGVTKGRLMSTLQKVGWSSSK